MKIINHVMSSDVHSNILTSFIKYLSDYNKNDIHITSVEAISEASVYHYHRPHLEKKLKPNSVVTVHHDLLESDPWLSLHKFLKVYKDASQIVCLNSVQKEILDNNDIKNSCVIPHGYNDDIFLPELKKIRVNDKLTLSLISKRYGRRVKGEAYFHEIIKRLDQELFDFILVGEGRSEEYQLLNDYGFDVKVFEDLPYRVFGSLYQNVDILLVLSAFEGGPANIPEAITSATPIVGFPVGMIPDYITDMENGIILTGNVDIDSRKLTDLATNKEEYEQLKKSAENKRHLAKTWLSVAEMYDSVYTNVWKVNNEY